MNYGEGVHDMVRDLEGFVLSVCCTRELLRPTWDTQASASYTATLNFVGFFMIEVCTKNVVYQEVLDAINR